MMIDIIKILHPIMTEEMEADLVFYLAHNKQMYFKGIVAIAFIAVLGFAIMCLVAWWFFLFGLIETGILMIFLSWVPLQIFISIKMYLHVRKDSIELSEKLDLLRGEV